MQGPGRLDIVNAGSWETGYSECRVLGLDISGEVSQSPRIATTGKWFGGRPRHKYRVP
ncbi:unnamed protein product, partial [Staurois parvus]